MKTIVNKGSTEIDLKCHNQQREDKLGHKVEGIFTTRRQIQTFCEGHNSETQANLKLDIY